jgi:hypothetical protein
MVKGKKGTTRVEKADIFTKSVEIGDFMAKNWDKSSFPDAYDFMINAVAILAIAAFVVNENLICHWPPTTQRSGKQSACQMGSWQEMGRVCTLILGD